MRQMDVYIYCGQIVILFVLSLNIEGLVLVAQE